MLSQQTVARVPVYSANDTREAELRLARPINLEIDGLSIQRAIDVIAARGGVTVMYRSAIVSKYRTPVTLHLVNTPLGVALERVLEGTSLKVVPLPEGEITIAEDAKSVILVGVVEGTVKDGNTKQGIAGVSVILDSATKGVVTRDDGSFRYAAVPSGAHQILFKHIGYVRVVRTVNVTDGATATVDVGLKPSTNQLDQVVVTGTVVPTELKAIPNAITVITAKDIEQRGITHIDQLFRGDVPGLIALNQGSGSGQANGGPVGLGAAVMFSRGATAISYKSAGVTMLSNDGTSSTNPIKTYVDGVELADPQWLSHIDPKSIERIEILTGPQASTIYGSNAMNGVMQVFTKRGTTARPQVSMNFLSGVIQNDFSSALTPQHDYGAQVSGVNGGLSYNAGGSWTYVGAWSPSSATTNTSIFGGARLVIPTSLGAVTTDVTARNAGTVNDERAGTTQAQIDRQVNGTYLPDGNNGRIQPGENSVTGQTFGITLGYTPTGWWSHEFGFGQDGETTNSRYKLPGYQVPSDSGFFIVQNATTRRTLRYTTTLHVPVTSAAQATVTLGTDAWQSLSTIWGGSVSTTTGYLPNLGVSRTPDHNTGAYLQTQMGVWDRLFVTYGLRAEWNPSFGAAVEPNYAPRYGVAYTQDFGAITAKLRASYGRSTRPPQASLKNEITAVDAGFSPQDIADYGNFPWYIANADLGPEYQQGSESGLELYMGSRVSMIITHYNQTVDHLIDGVLADSARSLVPYPISYGSSQDAQGYKYRHEFQNVNLASIRNQGWELQSSFQTGPITTRGTYSWTKSRVLGVDPKYRSFFSADGYPQYQVGATFAYLPEHTWALEVAYARPRTRVAINVNGIGQLVNKANDFFEQNLNDGIRLPNDHLRVTTTYLYTSFNQGYATADLNASYRLSAGAEGVLQVQNLSDHYANDFDARYASLGRQTKLGLRVRF